MDDTISRKTAIETVRKNTIRLTIAEEKDAIGHVAWSADVVYSDVMEGALHELPGSDKEAASDKPSKVEPFTTEEMVMFINMVEMMRKECDRNFYYNPILSSVNQKVRSVLWSV